MLEYGEIESEADWECVDETKPPNDWPEKGSIRAFDISLAYIDDIKVLKDIYFKIGGGQKASLYQFTLVSINILKL